MMKNKKHLIFLILGTVLAFLPAYLIRFNEQIFNWLFVNFGTYPSDLWNFFVNYLQHGLQYPPEYPVGLRFFYEIFGFYKYNNYFSFFTVNCLILVLCACGVTYLLTKIIDNTQEKKLNVKNIWYFWICAPSFLFYGLYNYDLPVVFLIVLATYLFLDKKYYLAVLSLAIGTVVKVFPIFLLPIFILRSPRKDWFKLSLFFCAIVLLCNLPYMLSDFDSWIYPYVWQISQNISYSAKAGTYWWIFYPIFGKSIGMVSLLFFLILYVYVWLKMKNAPFINLCIAVIIIFLATDRIYSPQYNIFILPFLVLANYKIDKKWFYSLEIVNVLHVAAFFYLIEHVILLQSIVAIKYISLFFLFKNNLIQSKKINMIERKG